MVRLVLVLIALVVTSAPALAAERCVGTVNASCAASHATVQQAVDAAQSGDLIAVGAGRHVERVVVTRRIDFVFEPGAVLTDEGLPDAPSAAVLDFRRVSNPNLKNVTIEVFASGFGIRATEGARTEVLKADVTCLGGGPAATGIAFLGGSRQLSQTSRVEGCDIGLLADGVTYEKLQSNILVRNGVGIRVRNGKGQVFKSTLDNNGIGLQVVGVIHTDINGNKFFRDPATCPDCVGLVWDKDPAPAPKFRCRQEPGFQCRMEFNNGHFVGYGAWEEGRAHIIRLLDGSTTYDYRRDPGCSNLWAGGIVDGVELPPWQSGECGGR